MNGAVVVEYRKVYGSVVIYPASENAALLAKLAGKKTLSESDLGIARQLGFQVERRNEDLAGRAAA